MATINGATADTTAFVFRPRILKDCDILQRPPTPDPRTTELAVPTQPGNPMMEHLISRMAHNLYFHDRPSTAAPQAMIPAVPNQPEQDAVEQLTIQIARILYPHNEQHAPAKQFPLRYNSFLYRHRVVGPLLAQQEPGMIVDPQQLKLLRDHLRFPVKCGEVSLVGLYELVKQFLALRKTWIRAAGEFYGLLAYVEKMDRQGGLDGDDADADADADAGAGPAFPSAHGMQLLCSELERTQSNYVSSSNDLHDFKLSDTFRSNGNRLVAYLGKVQAEEWKRQKQNKEAARKTEADAKKRAALKRRNLMLVERQMGGGATGGELGEAMEQRILDMMSQTMNSELGLAGGDKKKHRWF